MKKKATKRKTAPRKKSTPKKKAAKKKAATRKKTTSKKKTTPKKKALPKKKAVRRLSLAGEDNSMDVTVAFRLGGGKIVATLMRGGAEVDQKTIDTESTTKFTTVLTRDVLSLNGACSGTATLSTNRTTTPASDPSSPRKYQGPILENLRIK